jgi:hypothetical protein
MPENMVELALALLIAGVCIAVPVLILMGLLELSNRQRRK